MEHVSEDSNLHRHCHENLKTDVPYVLGVGSDFSESNQLCSNFFIYSLVIVFRTPHSNFLFVHCQITIVSHMNYHFCYKFQCPRSMKRKSTYQNAPAFPSWTVTDILGSLDIITISATVMWNQRMRDDLLWWTLQTKNRFCRRWMDGRSITSVHKWKIL